MPLLPFLIEKIKISLNQLKEEVSFDVLIQENKEYEEYSKWKNIFKKNLQKIVRYIKNRTSLSQLQLNTIKERLILSEPQSQFFVSAFYYYQSITWLAEKFPRYRFFFDSMLIEFKQQLIAKPKEAKEFFYRDLLIHFQLYFKNKISLNIFSELLAYYKDVISNVTYLAIKKDIEEFQVQYNKIEYQNFFSATVVANLTVVLAKIRQALILLDDNEGNLISNITSVNNEYRVDRFHRISSAFRQHPYFWLFAYAAIFNRRDFFPISVAQPVQNEFQLAFNYTSIIHNNPLSPINLVLGQNSFGLAWEDNNRIIFNKFNFNGIPLQQEKVYASNGRYPDLIYHQPLQEWVVAWQDITLGTSIASNALFHMTDTLPTQRGSIQSGIGQSSESLPLSEPTLGIWNDGNEYIMYEPTGGSYPLVSRKLYDLAGTRYAFSNAIGNVRQVHTLRGRFSSGESILISQTNITGYQEIMGFKFSYTGQYNNNKLIFNNFEEHTSSCVPSCIFSNPQGAILANGNYFATVYQYRPNNYTVGQNERLNFRIYDINFNEISSHQRVSNSNNSSQLSSYMETSPYGGFYVVWQAYAQEFPGLSTVYLKVFDAIGEAKSEDYRVSQYYGDNQSDPELLSLPSGDLVVAWKSNRVPGNGIWGVKLSTALSAVNTHQQINYIPNTLYDLDDIVITAPLFIPNANVTLTLSNPAAGSLTTTTSGNVVAYYNGTTGVWKASGNWMNINELFKNLYYLPALDTYFRFSINIVISNGFNGPLYDRIDLQPIGTTSQALSTQAVTTMAITSDAVTTRAATTQSITTESITTQPLTTSSTIASASTSSSTSLEATTNLSSSSASVNSTTTPTSQLTSTTSTNNSNSSFTTETGMTSSNPTMASTTGQNPSTSSTTISQNTTNASSGVAATTQPATTAALTTTPLTTMAITTKPVTTAALTTVPATTMPVTTVALTTAPITTVAATTQQSATTAALTTTPATTMSVTTAALTTAPPITTFFAPSQPIVPPDPPPDPTAIIAVVVAVGGVVLLAVAAVIVVVLNRDRIQQTLRDCRNTDTVPPHPVRTP